MALNFVRAGAAGMKIEQEKRRTFVVQRDVRDFINKGGFRVITNILCKKLFDFERLARLKVAGRIKVFTGKKDPVINSDLVQQVIEFANNSRATGQNPIEHIKVRNGGHNMSAGAASYFVDAMDYRRDIPSEVDYEELPKSHADVLRVNYFGAS